MRASGVYILRPLLLHLLLLVPLLVLLECRFASFSLSLAFSRAFVALV